MAGAIHKMAVYLGLVEDEVAYEDGYDSLEEEYAAYEDEDGAGPRPMTPAPTWPRRPAPHRCARPPISRGSRRCIRAHTMRRGRSVSTSAKAPRSS